MKHSLWTLLPLLLNASLASAELQEVNDADLANVSGQAGIYLSGDISINENGGPLWTCQADGSKCGGRVTMKPREDGGWFVLDDIRGSFSFQGLTLQSRTINSGFGGDGEKFNGAVLEIGLPDTVKMRDVKFAFGTANYASADYAPAVPGDPSEMFRQTNFFDFQLQGDMTMQGNLLVFPTGNP